MAAAEKLRDLSQPIDVAVLDATVAAFFVTESKEERVAADQILRNLQANPDMWLQVVHILQNTKSMHTKFFALQVLEVIIKYRWNALLVEQRDGMKNYISEVIVQLSSNEASFRSERLYVNKLNVILVQIVKHDWPAKWTSFIPDLVSAAKTSETICENCMIILKLLSEEVFDFSRGEMTQQKIKELKQSLNSEFKLIHELYLYVLSASQRRDLIRSTLSALHAYLSWIPLDYIFESPLLGTLLKLFSLSDYRNSTLQCLTEVAARSLGDLYDVNFANMYAIFIGQLLIILPLSRKIPEAYSSASFEDQEVFKNLTLFLSTFLKYHIGVLGTTPYLLLLSLRYMIHISYIDDTEHFKICLDYWHSLLYDQQSVMVPLPDVISSYCTSRLRRLMINRMVKPEDVVFYEDDNGNIVRDTMKDNDVVVQYETMRETLNYLLDLNRDDTKKQMSMKLNEICSKVVDEAALNSLTTLSWAIGSISEEQENEFMRSVCQSLWNLCEGTHNHEHKARVTSNLMYLVGQYPRLISNSREHMKTFIDKLFVFMDGTTPGVQDIACDTILKIVKKCKSEFVNGQDGENEPLIAKFLSKLPVAVQKLEPYQIHSFYESVGNMIQAESDPQKRDEYVQKLMALPNQKWAEIIGQARQSVEFLKDPGVIRTVLNILQTNTSAATSLGTYFLSQLSLLFMDMLNVYRMYSELVSISITNGGPYASNISFVKLLRSVKRETLKLIETFLDKAEDQPHIGKQFVTPMMEYVLADYARNVPDARESEVLSLFATIINKYKATMLDDVPNIFEAVFQCTLEMITKNFEDYPEHRLKFFSLLRAIATFCFSALIKLSSQQLKLVMDSIIWAFRHTERNIAETGLNLLLEMLKNFQQSAFCNQFFRSYFIQIEQEIIAVLTDTFHKPGFKLHMLVLQQLFCLVESGALTEPLWDAATVPYPYPNNAAFVREYTIKLLSSSFPNMTAAEVTQFVNGLYESRNAPSEFKKNIRDFLVQSKEFSA